MDITNLRILRKNLEAFIKADARSITLYRKVKVDSGAGSWVWSDSAEMINPQTFRLVPQKRRLSDLIENTQDGPIPSIQYVLVGYWDANVSRGDEFSINGTHYRVVAIEPHTNERAFTDRVVAQLEVRDAG